MPPLTVMVPSASRGWLSAVLAVHTAITPPEMVRLPLSMFSCCSAFTASFTGASMFRVSSRMVRLAAPSSSVVAPDLTPFLPLAVTFRVPEPHRVT